MPPDPTPDRNILEEGAIARIPAVAFLRSTWAILWCAIRHPLCTTVVDLSTGDAVSVPPENANGT